MELNQETALASTETRRVAEELAGTLNRWSSGKEVVPERKVRTVQLLVVSSQGEPLGMFFNLWPGLAELLQFHAGQAVVQPELAVTRLEALVDPFQDWYKVSREFVLWNRAQLVCEPGTRLATLERELPQTAAYFIGVAF
jgi:hypothetical protein